MAITIINHTVSSITSANNQTITVNSTGAQLIIVGIESNQGTIANTSCVDLGGANTFLRAHDNVIDAQQGTFIYYVVNPTNSSSLQIKGTSGAGGCGVTVTCINGFAGTPTLDTSKNKSNITTSGATSLATGSVTPSQANNIVVTCWGMNWFSAPGTLSINSSFSPLDTAQGISQSAIGTSYLIQSSATSQNPTWSTTNSITHAATVIVIFDDVVVASNHSNFFMFF